VEIRGTPHLRGIHYSLPVASAQVKSAILLAGLAASGRTHVTEPALSRDHTRAHARRIRRATVARGALHRDGRRQTLHGTR